MSEGSSYIGISKTTFILGLIVAILASSLISTVVTMQFGIIQGLKGEKGDKGDTGQQGLQGLNPIFACTYTSVESTTDTMNWVDMEDTSVEVTVNSTTSLIIMFSAEAKADACKDRIWVRVQISNDTQWFTPYPSYVYFTPKVSEELDPPANHRHILGYCANSYNFYAPSISSGTYTIKIQWRLQYAIDTGYVRSRTLAVMAFP